MTNDDIERKRARLRAALGLALIAEVERTCRIDATLTDGFGPIDPHAIADGIITRELGAVAGMFATITDELATASPDHYDDERGPLPWQEAIKRAYAVASKEAMR